MERRAPCAECGRLTAKALGGLCNTCTRGRRVAANETRAPGALTVRLLV